MKISKKIQKILVTTCWVVIGSGVLVLLVAAMGIKAQKTCKGIDIEIAGVKEWYFLDKDDVLRIVTANGMNLPQGQRFESFNLQQLEQRLEENVYVKDAELYFDNNLMLHVSIQEREPVARVFTKKNQSFYLDSSGMELPLRDNMIVRLPVFTSYDESDIDHKSDSLLKRGIVRLSDYISKNEFWTAQIAQVDIVGGKNFEMIPTLGNHIIQFGDGSLCEDKFNRLSLFYKQVLAKTGVDKYSRISVQYAKQVIGTKKGGMPKIDSIQALKNIRKMIDAAMSRPEDSTLTPVQKSEQPVDLSGIEEHRSMDTTMVVNEEVENESPAIVNPVKKEKAEIKKPVINRPATKKVIEKPKVKSPAPRASEQKLPKAVMKKIL